MSMVVPAVPSSHSLEQHGVEWVAELEEQEAEVCRRWQKTLDDLAARYAEIAMIRSLKAFTVRGRYSGVAASLDFIGDPPQIPAEAAMSVLRVYGQSIERGEPPGAAA